MESPKPITEERIAEVEALLTRIPVAPWRWHGHCEGSHPSVGLCTVSHGMVYIMDFARWGFGSAQPKFWEVKPEEPPVYGGRPKLAKECVVRERTYRDDIADLDHPVARFLRDSREVVEGLIARVRELEREAEWKRIQEQEEGERDNL